MPSREGVRLKSRRLVDVRGRETGHSQRRWQRPIEPLQSLRQWMIDQRLAVMEHVEEEGREWQLLPHLVDVESPAEAPHGDLKRQRSLVRRERDDFAVENQFTRWEC